MGIYVGEKLSACEEYFCNVLPEYIEKHSNSIFEDFFAVQVGKVEMCSEFDIRYGAFEFMCNIIHKAYKRKLTMPMSTMAMEFLRTCICKNYLGELLKLMSKFGIKFSGYEGKKDSIYDSRRELLVSTLVMMDREDRYEELYSSGFFCDGLVDLVVQECLIRGCNQYIPFLVAIKY